MFNFFFWESANVSLCLGHSSIDRILVASGGQFFASLLPFKNEAVPAIQVDVSVIRIAVDSRGSDKPLKDIGVLAFVDLAWVWVREAKQDTKVSHE